MINKLLLLFTLFFCLTVGQAQMTKAEKKEWKKKFKSAGIEGFKKLSEEKDEAKKQLSNLQSTNEDLATEVEDLEAKNSELQSEVEDYKKAAKETADKLSEQQADEQSDAYGDYARGNNKGVIFKVQVGSFRSFDITKYFNNHQNFSGDVDEDGTMKYTLGVFKEYWEADKFKKFMRSMGVKGAWVVSYKDGKRVNIKDVLEGTN